MSSKWQTWFLAMLLLGVAVVHADDEPTSPSDQSPPREEQTPLQVDDLEQCSRPTRYVQLDALFLTYGQSAARQPVVIRTVDDNFIYPGPTLASTTDATLGTQIGPRITFGILNDDCRGWELSYFGLFGGGGNVTVTGNNDLALPGDLGLASLNFFNSNLMTVTSRGELHSVELNRQRRIDDWTVLAGVRYLRVEDEFNIRGGDPDTTFGDYHLEAGNDLFGVQAGLRRQGTLSWVCWDLTGKAGLYGNSAKQSQYVTDDPNPNPIFYLRDPVSASSTEFAFVGEIQANLTIPLTQWLSLRGGYNLLWIEGVALAPNQLDFSYNSTSGSGLDSDGGLFLHGVHAGGEIIW